VQVRKFVKQKPIEPLLAPREVWRQEKVGGKIMKGCRKKNPWNFS
jgi:hypothetical protein